MLLPIFFILNLKAQINAAFSLDFGKSECVINFFKNGLYEILLFSPPGDYIFITNLSFGKYTFCDKQIICYDQYNGYTMSFKYESKYIFSQKSYYAFLNRKILFSKFYSDLLDIPPRFLSLIKDDPFNTINDQRKDFKIKGIGQYTFIPGIYKSNAFQTLTINKNGNYSMKIVDFILSKGIWKKNGNELIFFDTYLKSTFYSFIENNELINGFYFIKNGNNHLKREITF